MSEHGRPVKAVVVGAEDHEDAVMLIRKLGQVELDECGPDCDADCVCEDP